MSFRRIEGKLRAQLPLRRLRVNLDNLPVLGFWIGYRDVFAAEAVLPSSTFIPLNSISRKYGHTHDEIYTLLRQVADLTAALSPVVIVKGVRDRLEGCELGEFFSTVIRIERGLLPGPPTHSFRNLGTSFIISRQGIYFDGRYPSDMEEALGALPRGYAKKQIAQSLLRKVLESRITKYATAGESSLPIDRSSIVVLGQVVGDQAIESTITVGKNNLDLIRHVVDHPPIDYSRCYYKPHPKKRAAQRSRIKD